MLTRHTFEILFQHKTCQPNGNKHLYQIYIQHQQTLYLYLHSSDLYKGQKTTQQDVETDSNIYDIKAQLQQHHKGTACENYK